MTQAPAPFTPVPITLILRISGGSFETGFTASLNISEPGRVNPQQRYQLPPCAELPTAYQRWQSTYSALANTRKIQPVKAQTTQQSFNERLAECRQETTRFEHLCAEWFRHPIFEALRRCIVSDLRLRQLEQIPILMEADTHSHAQDVLLRKLPWHIWQLLERDLRKSELIMSAPVAPDNQQFSAPINILAVFGEPSDGIQPEKDLAMLEQLKLNGANLVPLDQPSTKQLNDALWEQRWDVLFFAGHSTSKDDPTGTIQLREGESISLNNLTASLNEAVDNGLKLAIFNSCDGLSLADYLAQRRVPVSIVMREPVPDIVARHFLEYFLEAFSTRQLNLQAAVRKARERLQWLESGGAQACPAATWLPIIYQNPNQSPLLWPAPLPEAAPESESEPVRKLPSLNSKELLKAGMLLLLLAVLVWIGKDWIKAQFADIPSASNPTVNANQDQVLPVAYDSLEERFSEGNRTLILDESKYLACAEDGKPNQSFEALKAEGVQAMGKNYEIAEEQFNQALGICKSPEARIYKNNAAIGENDAYTLAVIVPYSPTPDNAVQMLRGAATAQEQINQAGGINGKKLKLLIVEDSDNPGKAADIAKELIENKRDVIGALGHWTSGVSDRAIEVYESRQALAFMVPVSTLTDLVDNNSQWVFRTAASNQRLQTAIVDYLENLQPSDRSEFDSKIDKVAIFHVRGSNAKSSYSRDLTVQFAKQFRAIGGSIVPEEEFNLADLALRQDPEVTAAEMIKTAKESGAQAIFLAPNNNLTAPAEALIKAADREGLAVLTEVNMFQQNVLKRTCPASEGMVIALPWHDEVEINADYEAATTTLWGGPDSPVTAMTYNATQALVEAIRRSETNGEPTRSGVQKALSSDDFEVTATADAQPFTFENNERDIDAQLVQVVKVDPVPIEASTEASTEPFCRFEPIP